mmetsp:Transcript_72944/g.128838  ORF Transcript_72944/g.128838 Transcript_72944/m.128838 type:complete len:598 (-) Transcript_72944:178-1971(-)
MSGNSGDAGTDYVEGRLLDGFLLLAAGGSSQPDGVVTVNLSSLQIVDVAEEDLAFFGHLDRLDVSDNQLGYDHILDQLSRVPRLSTLNLACNSISALQVQQGMLRHLEVLDLSFNGLHGDVLSQLARLPSLVSLNLSSNCISSVPPEEELMGMQALEQLILDANDLVQFMQWRALDALPRLKKLSLTSNRVKRLKDDAPDTASGTTASYFPALEELDLSSNEISGVTSLPVVQLFQRLNLIRLSDNPCCRGKSAEAQKIPGVTVIAKDSKPFYMNGNGCFQKAEKVSQPKLKIDRKRLRKVKGDVSQVKSRSMSQLGYLDEEANQLLVAMSGDVISEINQGRVSSAPASTAVVPAGDNGILHDELSESELEQIFKDRRATIESRFEADVEEPQSFMRQPEDQAAKEKLSQLMRQMRQQQEEESGASTTTSPANAKAPASSFFLTGGDEVDGLGTSRAAKPRLGSAGYGGVRGTPSPAARDGRTSSKGSNLPAESGEGAEAGEEGDDDIVPSPFQAFLAAGQGRTPAGGDGPGGVSLPPIAGGQSTSKGFTPVAGAATGLPDLRSGGKKQFQGVADQGVKEAIRALRAATMSEYAVAA